MTKVTVKPGASAQASQGSADVATPSQQLIQDATQPFATVDALGRNIVLKRPDVLAQFRLIEALGDTAKNDVYRVMCIPMIYLVSIDGLPVPPASNKAQVEALISRLGAEGFAALDKAISERFPPPKDEGDDEIKK